MPSKRALLQGLDRAASTWAELAAEARVGDPTRPGAMGEWTFVDLAGHLAGWRVRAVDRMEAAAAGVEPPPPPWPATLARYDEAGIEAINRWIYGRYHDRPLDEILAESRDQWSRLRAATEAIPEPALITSGRYPWLPDYPLSQVIVTQLTHLHEDHEADIRTWLVREDA